MGYSTKGITRNRGDLPRMNRVPKVSIITTVHNEAQFLPVAIESILTQTEEDFEFIIVDDGSTDKTLELIEYYHKIDKRIRMFANLEKKGRAYSRNLAIENAEAEFIMIFDGDDISVNTRIESQLSFFRYHPDIDYLGGNCFFIKQDTERLLERQHIMPLNHHEIYWELFFSYPFHHTTTMGKRRLFEKIGGYPNEFPVNEDILLWMKMANYGARFANTHEKLVYYRVNEAPYHYILHRFISKYLHREFISRFLGWKIPVGLFDIIWSGVISNGALNSASSTNITDAIEILIKLYTKYINNVSGSDVDSISNSLVNRIENILRFNYYQNNTNSQENANMYTYTYIYSQKHTPQNKKL